MKLLMILADSFEDVEAIATLDVLSRGKVDVTLVNALNKSTVTSKVGHEIKLNKYIKDINYKDFDGVIIPGGPASFNILDKLNDVEDCIHYFANNHLLVASICAAPFLVGRLGYLKGRNFTCHPGFEDQVIEGIYHRDLGVVVDENFITAKSMFYSIDFGLAIFEYFNGHEAKLRLENSLKGEK